MSLYDSTGIPDGRSRLQSAINSAYFPYEITEVAEPQGLSCCLETKNFGPLQFSHLQSNSAYRGRRRKDVRHTDDFVLHLMEEGSAILTQRQRSVKTMPGTLVLITPDPSFSGEKLGAGQAFAVPIPAQLLTMHFPEARDWGLSIRGSSLGPAAVLREVLESCWRQRNAVSAVEAVHLSKAFIQLVGATFGKDDGQLASFTSRSMRLHYGRIRDLVIQNLENEGLSADFVTNRLGISKSYLFAILKEANTTLGRLILEQRLERCRGMLSDPAMGHVSISEIAFSIGFHELPHFSRCFTKHYGESPRAFRSARKRVSN